MGTRLATHPASASAEDQRERTAEDALWATIDSYDRSAVDYAARFAATELDIPMARFVDLLPSKTGRVLDAGCGAGRDLESLRSRGLKPIGVDLSTGLLREAQRRTTAPLIQGDLRRLPFADGVMDGVWACASLLHLDETGLELALDELVRVTARGGAIFVSVRPGAGTEWRPDAHGGRRLFYLHEVDEVRRLLSKCGLHLVEVKTEPGYGQTLWINGYALVPK